MFLTQGEANSSLHSLPRTLSACKISSAQSEKKAVEEEHLYNIAVENKSEPSLSARPLPSLPLPPPLPPPMPPPRAVCRLTIDNQQANSPPPHLPSSEHAASPVVEEAPALPIPVQDGGVQEAKWATPRAQEGLQLAPRRPGSASLTGRRLTQHNPPPSAKINMSRTRTRSTAVRAGAIDDHSRLHASRTLGFMCTRTVRAGSCCVTKPQDSIMSPDVQTLRSRTT